MFKRIKRLVIVVTAIAGAIAPSAAYARAILPDRQPYFASPATLQTSPPASAHRVGASTSQGFSWHDAEFGAAGMLLLIGIGAGTTLAVRRRMVIS